MALQLDKTKMWYVTPNNFKSNIFNFFICKILLYMKDNKKCVSFSGVILSAAHMDF